MIQLQQLGFNLVQADLQRPSSLHGIGKGCYGCYIHATGGDTKELDTSEVSSAQNLCKHLHNDVFERWRRSVEKISCQRHYVIMNLFIIVQKYLPSNNRTPRPIAKQESNSCLNHGTHKQNYASFVVYICVPNRYGASATSCGDTNLPTHHMVAESRPLHLQLCLMRTPLRLYQRNHGTHKQN